VSRSAALAASAIFLLCASRVFAQAPPDASLGKRFAELITKSGEEHCAAISYFEPHESDSIYDQWDARCVSGREYRILLPRIAQAKAEAIPCEVPGAPPTDCFRRTQRRRDMPGHVELFTMRARGLIEGGWIGAATLEIGSATISSSACRDVPMAIVGDRTRLAIDVRTVGSKSGAATLRYAVNVREIAIELRRDAKCRQAKESLGDVLVFPITNIGFMEASDASCSVRVRVYRTRGDFDRAKPAGELPLRKEKCEYLD
jgi:hypothetical protein